MKFLPCTTGHNFRRSDTATWTSSISGSKDITLIFCMNVAFSGLWMKMRASLAEKIIWKLCLGIRSSDHLSRPFVHKTRIALFKTKPKNGFIHGAPALSEQSPILGACIHLFLFFTTTLRDRCYSSFIGEETGSERPSFTELKTAEAGFKPRSLLPRALGSSRHLRPPPGKLAQ